MYMYVSWEAIRSKDLRGLQHARTSSVREISAHFPALEIELMLPCMCHLYLYMYMCELQEKALVCWNMESQYSK